MNKLGSWRFSSPPVVVCTASWEQSWMKPRPLVPFSCLGTRICVVLLAQHGLPTAFSVFLDVFEITKFEIAEVKYAIVLYHPFKTLFAFVTKISFGHHFNSMRILSSSFYLSHSFSVEVTIDGCESWGILFCHSQICFNKHSWWFYFHKIDSPQWDS